MSRRGKRSIRVSASASARARGGDGEEGRAGGEGWAKRTRAGQIIAGVKLL